MGTKQFPHGEKVNFCLLDMTVLKSVVDIFLLFLISFYHI